MEYSRRGNPICENTECGRPDRHPVGHCLPLRETAKTYRTAKRNGTPRRWRIPPHLLTRRLSKLHAASIEDGDETVILVHMDGQELAVLNIEWLAAIEKA